MKWLLMAALVFALGVIDGLYARVDDLIVQEADEKAIAAHYAGVLAGCLNGHYITVNEKRAVKCWRIK